MNTDLKEASRTLDLSFPVLTISSPGARPIVIHLIIRSVAHLHQAQPFRAYCPHHFQVQLLRMRMEKVGTYITLHQVNLGNDKRMDDDNSTYPLPPISLVPFNLYLLSPRTFAIGI